MEGARSVFRVLRFFRRLGSDKMVLKRFPGCLLDLPLMCYKPYRVIVDSHHHSPRAAYKYVYIARMCVLRYQSVTYIPVLSSSKFIQCYVTSVAVYHKCSVTNSSLLHHRLSICLGVIHYTTLHTAQQQLRRLNFGETCRWRKTPIPPLSGDEPWVSFVSYLVKSDR